LPPTKRVFLIVHDSFGIDEMSDAAHYDDETRADGESLF